MCVCVGVCVCVCVCVYIADSCCCTAEPNITFAKQLSSKKKNPKSYRANRSGPGIPKRILAPLKFPVVASSRNCRKELPSLWAAKKKKKEKEKENFKKESILLDHGKIPNPSKGDSGKTLQRRWGQRPWCPPHSWLSVWTGNSVSASESGWAPLGLVNQKSCKSKGQSLPSLQFSLLPVYSSLSF